MATDNTPLTPEFTVCPPAVGGDPAVIRLSGPWRLSHNPPAADTVLESLAAESGVRSVAFDTTELTEWDSRLLTFLRIALRHCAANDITVEPAGLPPGVQRLLDLADAVAERSGAARSDKRPPFLAAVGAKAGDVWDAGIDSLRFVGDTTVASAKFLLGRAQYRRSDLMLTIQECGAFALGIVSLISFLVGLILAYVGSVQLRTFGAQIYVADLVAVAMTREMAAIMTAIVIAGRTGAAFAAQLGTMEVNDEIDAFRTMGISPVEFLVLPRILALVLMMPLLVLYADLMGILGGAVIGVGVLDLTMMEYFQQTFNAVGLTDLFIGLFKGGVFGVLVAMAGCLKGMRCGRSASAVGAAATAAVVMSIVLIIVSDSVITVICDILRI